MPQDYAEAVKWYRKGCRADHFYAPYALGVMHARGYGVPQNFTEAAKWYRKAVEQGNAAAQLYLGLMYANGAGVAQDYVQAHTWLNLAASKLGTPLVLNLGPFPPPALPGFVGGTGSSASPSQKDLRDQALKNRDIVAARMTTSQVAEAQRLAQVCVKDYDYKKCSFDRSQVSRSEVQPPPAPQNKVASTGTGFFASESGHIVTNAHVVEGCFAVRSSRGGQISKLSVDEQSDLALYIASEKPKAFARLRGEYGARIGEPVVTVGFPLSGLLSSDPIVTTGIISALSGLRNDRRTIQTSAPVQPGNSGGRLLGENGSVVGVVVGKLDAMKIAEAIGDIPQNVNFAVSLGTLQSFLNANGVSYLLDSNNTAKSPADIAADASRYVVQIECLR